MLGARVAEICLLLLTVLAYCKILERGVCSCKVKPVIHSAFLLAKLRGKLSAIGWQVNSAGSANG